MEKTATKNGNCAYCSEPILDEEPFVILTTNVGEIRHHVACRRKPRGIKSSEINPKLRLEMTRRGNERRKTFRNRNEATRAFERVCAMNKTLVEIIADGLDASVDGRGYNVEHHRAVTLANAAPALLEALREAWEIAADHRRPMFDQLVKWEILLTGLSRRDDENQLMLNVEGGGR